MHQQPQGPPGRESQLPVAPKETAESPVETDASKVGWTERLLAPQTLNLLMACGGGLLVVGLVIWLWTQGVFANPVFAAVTLGATNLGLLALGVTAARYSRYQLAGRAMTMLGCLVLPLNLWFYHAQDLITLDQQGHLWIPALICCAIYVGVARVLADWRYVYAIVGGVAMTGMLLLADAQVNRFWEITSPSALLVALGMICIHVERLFPANDGPFSRAKFGRAFFDAGHLSLAFGLLVLVCGHVAGWLYDPWLAQYGWFAKPSVATHTNLKLIALALSLGAVYSYVYSLLAVADRGRYVVSAVLALAWCGMIGFDLLNIPLTMEVAALATALAAATISAVTWLHPSFGEKAEPHSTLASLIGTSRQIQTSLVIGANVASFVLLLSLYLRARVSVPDLWSSYEFSRVFVIAAATASFAAWMQSRIVQGRDAPISLFGAIALALMAIGGAASVIGLSLSPALLVGEMLLPLGLAVGAGRMASESLRRDVALAAGWAAALLLVVSFAVSLGVAGVAGAADSHLWLAILFAEATACFGVAAHHTKSKSLAVVAGGSASGFAWQLLIVLGVQRYEFLFAATLVGLMGLILAAIARRYGDKGRSLALIGEWTGLIAVTGAVIGALLSSLMLLLSGEYAWHAAWLLAIEVAASVIAALLSADRKWRRHFLSLAGVEAVMMALMIGAVSEMTTWQILELFATAVGVFAFSAGLLGLQNEGEERRDAVTANLLIGSLMSAGPATLGLLVHRFGAGPDAWGWARGHEIGVLAIGLALLAAGVLCRVRAATLVGGATLGMYLFSLVLLVRLPEQLQTTAVYMMAGGGTFFALAVLLSVYRDRLLALPERVREGKGVFQVLRWR